MEVNNVINFHGYPRFFVWTPREDSIDRDPRSLYADPLWSHHFLYGCSSQKETITEVMSNEISISSGKS